MNKSKQYFYGLKAGAPVFFGYVPAAVAYSIIAGQAGLSGFETVLMSLMVFAGASQMMAGGMILSGASVFSIVLTTFMLNFRHLIMSMCVSAKLKKEKLPIRLLAAFGVTDESFGVFSATTGNLSSSIWYFLGIVTITYLSWFLGTVLGVIANNILPDILSKSCSVALYAMFIALLFPGIKKNIKLLLLVALTAILNTLLQRFTDPSYSLILSTLICAAIGVFFVDDDLEASK